MLTHPELNFPSPLEIFRTGGVKSVYCSGRISKQRIIFEGKGPKGWNKNILLLYFTFDQKAQNHKYSL